MARAMTASQPMSPDHDDRGGLCGLFTAIIGCKLQSVSRSVMWWIGDWLRFGDGKWGETSAQAVSMTGRQEQTLLDAQWVASKFVDNSRRREELSWSHHKEVAALPPAEADELLDLAEREGLSTRELRAEVSRRKAARVIGAAMPGGDRRVMST